MLLEFEFFMLIFVFFNFFFTFDSLFSSFSCFLVFNLFLAFVFFLSCFRVKPGSLVRFMVETKDFGSSQSGQLGRVNLVGSRMG
jgi:hypothetical protein